MKPAREFLIYDKLYPAHAHHSRFTGFVSWQPRSPLPPTAVAVFSRVELPARLNLSREFVFSRTVRFAIQAGPMNDTESFQMCTFQY